VPADTDENARAVVFDDSLEDGILELELGRILEEYLGGSGGESVYPPVAPQAPDTDSDAASTPDVTDDEACANDDGGGPGEHVAVDDSDGIFDRGPAEFDAAELTHREHDGPVWEVDRGERKRILCTAKMVGVHSVKVPMVSWIPLVAKAAHPC
jgi:hypothetical protein